MERNTRRQADEIVRRIEERIYARLGSQAFLDHRFGTVAAIIGSTCSVYLGADPTYASPNFRIPVGMSLTVGNTVRVVIDPRGDRHVDSRF